MELWIFPYTDMLKKTQRFPKVAIRLDALHEKQSQTLLESPATHRSCETHRLSAPPKARLKVVQAGDAEPGLDNQGMALLPPSHWKGEVWKQARMVASSGFTASSRSSRNPTLNSSSSHPPLQPSHNCSVRWVTSVRLSEQRGRRWQRHGAAADLSTPVQMLVRMRQPTCAPRVRQSAPALTNDSGL